MELEALEHIAVVLGFFGGLFHFAVLRPLNNTILELKMTLDELRQDMKRAEERWNAITVKLEGVDHIARAAHHRLDSLINFYEKTHNVKIPHIYSEGKEDAK